MALSPQRSPAVALSPELIPGVLNSLLAQELRGASVSPALGTRCVCFWPVRASQTCRIRILSASRQRLNYPG